MSTTRLDHLDRIDPKAVVILQRANIVTVHDVLATDSDSLAYLLDSYDAAQAVHERCVAHAQEEGELCVVERSGSAKVPGGISVEKGKQDPASERAEGELELSSGAETESGSETAAHEATQDDAELLPERAAPAELIAFDGAEAAGSERGSTQKLGGQARGGDGKRSAGPGAPTNSTSDLGLVLGLVGERPAGLGESAWRRAFSARIDALREGLHHGLGEGELAAVLALDPADAGTGDGAGALRAAVERACSPGLRELLRSCDRVLSVSIGPDGRVSQAWTRSVASASGSARKVAVLVSVCRLGAMAGMEGSERGLDPMRQLYFRALADALSSVERSPMVDQLRALASGVGAGGVAKAKAA